MKKKNILPGLCLSNEYISRDESLHVEHAVMLYGKLQNKLSDKDFMEIMKEAVDIEIEFITLAIPANSHCSLQGRQKWFKQIHQRTF